ncbi:exodeoxyribonuclease V subunit alpha [Gordonia sp. DT219]|uniref:exodeoxyribonuclease V subunit alpha n=1 Tax=Gordonia sp. DT219 TaxID=3416658 RepID=UPI003CF56BFA
MTTTPPSAIAAEPHGIAAAGLLHQAMAAGILDAADIHVATRLVGMCGEPVSDTAQLVTALAVRAVRLGSTCLAPRDVAEPIGDTTDPAMPALTLPSPEAMITALRSSPLVRGGAGGPLRPLVVADSADGPLVYLRKYFQQEQVIRTVLAERSESAPGASVEEILRAVDDVFAGTADVAPRQRLATAVAATRWTSVLTGGPGTGKTYTVARILAVLERLGSARLHVAVCAPTGRAVAQLQASLDGMRRALGTGTGTGAHGDVAAPSVHAVTVHGLLGWRPGSRPRYGRTNRLPHDVVVVDETSMLSVTAMSHLLEAVRPDARLILVGDPHQLASVEAGAVLADLVEREPSGTALDAVTAGLADESGITVAERPRLADGIVELTRNFRNRDGIAAVATAVNAGDADGVLELIGSGDFDDVTLVDADEPAIRDDIVAWGTALWSAARTADAQGALRILDSHRVLCAHREGQWGVQGWSRQITEWLNDVPGHPVVNVEAAIPAPGVPILVTANDRQNKVFNGDCGVAVALLSEQSAPSAGEGEPALTVAFRRSEFSDPVFIPPARLADTMWAYAMTIHRSQGSQFDAVTVVLPPADSPLLTRELLYTAITRAKTRVRIVGSPETLRAAVGRRVHRASGLRSALANPPTW